MWFASNDSKLPINSVKRNCIGSHRAAIIGAKDDWKQGVIRLHKSGGSGPQFSRMQTATMAAANSLVDQASRERRIMHHRNTRVRICILTDRTGIVPPATSPAKERELTRMPFSLPLTKCPRAGWAEGRGWFRLFLTFSTGWTNVAPLNVIITITQERRHVSYLNDCP